MSGATCRHCDAEVHVVKQCWNLPAGHCVAKVQAVLAVLKPISLALWCRLFKWGLNLPPWHCRAGVQVV